MLNTQHANENMMKEQPQQAVDHPVDVVFASELAQLVMVSLRAGGVVPHDALVADVADELVASGVGQALVSEMKRSLGTGADEAVMRRRAKDMVMQHYTRIEQQSRDVASPVAADGVTEVAEQIEYDIVQENPALDAVATVEAEMDADDAIEADPQEAVAQTPVLTDVQEMAPAASAAVVSPVTAPPLPASPVTASAVVDDGAVPVQAPMPVQAQMPVMAIAVEYEQNKKMILTPVSFDALVVELENAPVAQDQVAEVSVSEQDVAVSAPVDALAVGGSPVVHAAAIDKPMDVAEQSVIASAPMAVTLSEPGAVVVAAPVADMADEAVDMPVADIPVAVAVEAVAESAAPLASAADQVDVFAASVVEPVQIAAPEQQNEAAPVVMEFPVIPSADPVVAAEPVAPPVMQMVMPRVTVPHVAIVQLAPHDVAPRADMAANPVFDDVQNAFAAASSELQSVQSAEEDQDIRALFGIQTSDLGVDVSIEKMLAENNVTAPSDVFDRSVALEPAPGQDWYADALAQQMKAMMQYAA